MGDSSGFSFMRYEDWEDAKMVSRSLFVKLHILVSPHRPISACTVTGGCTHGSPVFRNTLLVRIPEGTGDVILDAAYFANENCRDQSKGEKAHNRSREQLQRLGPYSDMPRWYESDPDGYKTAYS